MQPTTLINHIRASSAQILRLIEQAQAVAAAQVQEWNKLGGSTFLTGFDYTGLDIDGNDITAAISSMTTALPDILGDHGTNLYTVKD